MTGVGISYFLISKLYRNCLGLQIPEFVCLWNLLIMVTGQYSSLDGCNLRLSLFITLTASSEKGFFFLHTLKFIKQKLTLHSSYFQRKRYLLILSEKLDNTAYL